MPPKYGVLVGLRLHLPHQTGGFFSLVWPEDQISYLALPATLRGAEGGEVQALRLLAARGKVQAVDKGRHGARLVLAAPADTQGGLVTAPCPHTGSSFPPDWAERFKASSL